jgi:hypothetical protein
VGLKMAIFQNQVKKRVIIHYSSFDPPILDKSFVHRKMLLKKEDLGFKPLLLEKGNDQQRYGNRKKIPIKALQNDNFLNPFSIETAQH